MIDLKDPRIQTLSPKGICLFYDISKWTIYRWIWERKFPIVKLGRKVLIPVAEFEEFLNMHRVEPHRGEK